MESSTTSATMEHYVIYSSPADFPGQFVVRRWLIAGGRCRPDGAPIAVTCDLAAARGAIPDGFTCLGRFPGDDPVIVEVWI